MIKKIYTNPGHSDRDPGAVGYEVERELNVKVTEYMNEYLLAHYECEVRSNPGTMGSLTEICNDANAWGADLLVSNHNNAGKGDGYEALVYSEKRVELGKIFAKYVQEAGQNLRSSAVAPGVKIRTDLSVLKNTNMPAILNEGAFVDNWEDIQDWNDDAELQKLGIAYAKAAAEFLELAEKKLPEPVKEEPKQEPKQEGYTLKQFIEDVQRVTGSKVDGIAGPETLGNTVTVSRWKNRKHPVVEFIQKRLYALGYTEVGKADGVAGAKFDKALKKYQKDNNFTKDGEATAKKKTWQKLLGMI